MAFVISRATKVCQIRSQVLCDVVLFTQAASSMILSVKRLLRLLTLWTMSDHPYLVEVLHRRPFNRRTSLKTMLQSQTAWYEGSIRLMKLTVFCLPLLASTTTFFYT